MASGSTARPLVPREPLHCARAITRGIAISTDTVRACSASPRCVSSRRAYCWRAPAPVVRCATSESPHLRLA
eukprot:6133130-Prymnesium_polylepis.1